MNFVLHSRLANVHYYPGETVAQASEHSKFLAYKIVLLQDLVCSQATVDSRLGEAMQKLYVSIVTQTLQECYNFAYEAETDVAHLLWC